MVGHKTNLNKFKKSEIISSIFSDKNCMKLEIKFCRKLETTFYLKRTKKSKRKLKISWDYEIIDTDSQNLWDRTKAILRGKFTARQAYLKKQESIQINNQTFILKELEKEEQSPKLVEERK